MSSFARITEARKLQLSVEDSILFGNALDKIEKIRNMLTQESLEIVTKSAKEIVEEEREEAARQRILIRQSSQEKIMEDAIQAFRSLEHIRELFSPVEFTELTQKASQRVRAEQIERTIQIRNKKLKENIQHIDTSFRKVDEIFKQHRDEIQSKQPEKKRARKNSDPSSSSDA